MDYATVVQEIKNADPVEQDQGRIAPQYANHGKLNEKSRVCRSTTVPSEEMFHF